MVTLLLVFAGITWILNSVVHVIEKYESESQPDWFHVGCSWFLSANAFIYAAKDYHK